MRLVRDVKATNVAFHCDSLSVNGLYRVGKEVVAVMCMTDEPYGGYYSFYAFRGQLGTAAESHEKGTVMELIKEGENLWSQT